jgi:hypothetical protein
MEPVAETQSLYHWPAVDLPAELAADPSFRHLRDVRLREGLAFQLQSGETQRLLVEEAIRIGAALTDSQGEIRFQLPGVVLRQGDRKGEHCPVEVPAEFRRQIIAGFLKRLPVKDIRSAFRIRLSQLENSGYISVQIGAGLLRFAVVRHLVHDRLVERQIPALPTAEENLDPLSAIPTGGEEIRREELREVESIGKAEAVVLQLWKGMSVLNQAVSIAPYMYADEEYQLKRNLLLAGLVAHGRALAYHHVRRIILTVRRRAGANDLNRGLRVSLPYFDDRELALKNYEMEVIPPGRTMFVPAFVALAAAREQEKVGQENSLSPSTRMHLLAGLKSLEQAFDNRPR